MIQQKKSVSGESSLPPAILLMGPTASGKTDLAMQLSNALPCDLISVDSVMVYREMDIGSAKPDQATLQRYPHRLIDIKDPADPYSAADFREDALREIRSVLSANRIPLLVGGTMMYYRALLSGIADMPGADSELRAKLVAEAGEKGWPALHQRLEQLDPVAASKIHPNNRQRIQRALEVCLSTGKTFSSFWGAQSEASLTDWNRQLQADLPCSVFPLAIAPPDRETLHVRISQRFQKMLEAGFIEEVKKLFERPDLSPDLPSVRAVGYRQMWHYLAGDYDEEEMIRRGEAATRQLAKRQMTWLRSWPGLQWLSSTDSGLSDKALNIIRAQLQSCNSL